MSKDVPPIVPISPEKLQAQINLLRKDMVDMTGFVTQEFIKSAQANKGKLLDASSQEHKDQVNSLLNADPKAPENQGKPVLSLRGTEQGIQARIDKLIKENGVPAEAFDGLRADMVKIRTEFESKALSNAGLKELVDNRIKGNLLLNAVQFMKSDEKGNPISGLTPNEKQDVINKVQGHVIVTDSIRDAYLSSDKTKGEKIVADTNKLLAQAFSVEGNNDKGFSTLDPKKMNPENIQKFKKSIKLYALEKIIDEYVKSTDDKVKKSLEDRYNEIQKMGEKKPPEVLTLKDSNLGKFLSDEKNVQLIAKQSSKVKGDFQDIDFTKCDLSLIAKCKEVYEKVDKERARDYGKFTNAQKAGVALSTLLGPVGPVVAYFAIKSHSESAGQGVKNQVEQSLERENILGELEFLSKNSPSKVKSHEVKKVEGKKHELPKESQSIYKTILKHVSSVKDDSKKMSNVEKLTLQREGKATERSSKAK